MQEFKLDQVSSTAYCRLQAADEACHIEALGHPSSASSFFGISDDDGCLAVDAFVALQEFNTSPFHLGDPSEIND